MEFAETREPIVYPHELAMLEDILLLTPYGVCRVEKYRLYENAQEKLLPIPNVIQTTTVPLLESINNNTSSIMRSKVEDKEGGTKRMSIEERIVKRKKFVAKIEQQKRLELKKERDEKRKQDQRRNYIIGELVTKYFPEVIKFEQGTKIENTVTFEPLETFLSELAADQELMKILRERVASKIKQSSELERCQSSNCPDV